MKKLQNVLLATDFLKAADAAQEVAAHLSWVFDSKITICHVLERLNVKPTLQLQLQRQITDVLNEIAAGLSDRKVQVAGASMIIGQPATEILRKADEIKADLILIGAGIVGKFEKFSVGPVAESVIQHSHIPVLAVKPGAPAPAFQKILCPVDHSDVSRRGLVNAIRLARAFKGQLVVLTVVPAVPPLALPVEAGALIDAELEYEKQWRTEFDAFLGSMDFGDVSWTSEVAKGPVAQEIVAACRRLKADVLVIGATGRTGLARVLMGSVTRRILRDLPCSILTVHHENVLDDVFDEDARIIGMLLAEGRELHKSSDFPSALVKLRQVLARNPFHTSALKMAAEASEKVGDTDAAVRFRRRFERIENMAALHAAGA